MMDETLTTALMVTLVGMAVVFVAMSLFYASMHLLTALAKGKAKRAAPAASPGQQAGLPPENACRPDRLRAAAVAVALARAERMQVPEPALDEWVSPLSPWGDFYRQRQLRPDSRGRLA